MPSLKGQISTYKQREQETQEVKRKAKISISDSFTEELSWSDYSAVSSYFEEKFPGVDISHIKIYAVDGYVLNKIGWEGFAGYYIDCMKIIILKRNRNHKRKTRMSPFNEKLSKYHARLSNEDILVHEGIHAISAKANRSTRHFRFLEEGYVYTNCVDFYRRKGRTDIDIVNEFFLPFCVNDILNGNKMKAVMKDVDEDLGTKMGSKLFSEKFKKDISAEEYNKKYSKFFNNHPYTVVKFIVRHARKMGLQMIDKYEKYERDVSIVTDKQADKYSRFANLKMDEKDEN